MYNRIRIARGTTSQITASQQFAEVGQPFYDTDKKYLYIGQSRDKLLPAYSGDDSITTNRIVCQQPILWDDSDVVDFDSQTYYIHPTHNAGLEIHTGTNHTVGFALSQTYRYYDERWYEKNIETISTYIEMNDKSPRLKIHNNGGLIIDGTGKSGCSLSPSSMTIEGDFKVIYPYYVKTETINGELWEVAQPFINMSTGYDKALGLYRVKTIATDVPEIKMTDATLKVDVVRPVADSGSVVGTSIGTDERWFENIYVGYVNTYRVNMHNWTMITDADGSLLFQYGDN